MKPLLLTVGNIYLDNNVFGINSGGEDLKLKGGHDYSASSGERVIGGSAVNAAMQASRLGIEVGFVGKIGTDYNGEEVKKSLKVEGILSNLVSEDPNLSTSVAFNLVGQNGQFIGVHYGEASRSLSVNDIDLSDPLFERCKAIYFGGTVKQPLLIQEGEMLFRDLQKKGISIFYDPNRFPVQDRDVDRSLIIGQMAYVDGYFPNEDELLQLTGKKSVDEALDLMVSTGVGFVALKQGPEGCRIRTKGDDFTIDGHRVEPITTVGAGDCFNATFIAYRLNGKSLRSCAELATAAAAIKVSQNIWPDEAAIIKMHSSLQQ